MDNCPSRHRHLSMPPPRALGLRFPQVGLGAYSGGRSGGKFTITRRPVTGVPGVTLNDTGLNDPDGSPGFGKTAHGPSGRTMYQPPSGRLTVRDSSPRAPP